MDKKNFSNFGEQIAAAVQDALNSIEFAKFKKDIGNTAESTFNEVRKNFKMNQGHPEEKHGMEQKQWGESNHQNTKNNNQVRIPIAKNPAGSVSGVLFTIFGFLGTGVFGILLVVYGIINIVMNLSYSLVNSIGLGALLFAFVASTFMGISGIQLRRRVKRFKQYVRQLRGRSYCSIKELASHIGEPAKFVVKDLRKMIKLGMFPEGHIDEQQTSLMLTYEVYEQYQKTQEGLKLRAQEEIKRQKEEQEVKDPATRELRDIIDEGKNYIKKIKEANDAIPGEDISRKLYRLEEITRKIFNYVEQHPEQLSEINKFMNYYLPTTLKLVTSYRELDAQPVQGENIKTAKNEIQKTLDTINIAFENLLDSLFKDIAFDISTDISVLETMLTQEGLTESDFKK